jgi:hypothetical protein
MDNWDKGGEIAEKEVEKIACKVWWWELNITGSEVVLP